MLSVYGKLPTAGDFLTIEVPRVLLRPLEDWLATGTAAAREATIGDWHEAFDAGGTWYFWIGEKVLGRRIAGVMRPSRDRVGRRFPVLIFASNEDPDAMPDAPVLEDGQELYEGLSEELTYLATQPPDAISERLKTAATESPEPAKAQPFFWAVAQENGPEGWEALLDEARYADHAAATARRSYWWQPGSPDSPGALLAAEGMPGPENFAVFLSGVGVAGFANAPESA